MTHDPAADEFKVAPDAPVNISIIFAHTITLVAMANLHGAVAVGGTSSDNVSYKWRLATARRAAELIRTIRKVDLPMQMFPMACGVRRLSGSSLLVLANGAYLFQFAWCAIAWLLVRHLRRLSGQMTAAISGEAEQTRRDFRALSGAVADMAALLPGLSE